MRIITSSSLIVGLLLSLSHLNNATNDEYGTAVYTESRESSQAQQGNSSLDENNNNDNSTEQMYYLLDDDEESNMNESSSSSLIDFKFTEPYANYSDFVQLVDENDEEVRLQNSNANEENENRRHKRSTCKVPEIYDIYDNSTNQHSTYEVLHKNWTKLNVNSFNFDTNSRQRYVKPVLKVYWSFNRATMPSYLPIVAISEVEYESARNFKPHVEIINNYISREQIASIVEKNIEESFDSWSLALNGTVEFQKIPYDQKLLKSEHFDKVVILSFENRIHREEHTGLIDYFESTSTLAHAATNFLHYNKAFLFYIAPTTTTKYIVTVIDHVGSNKKTLHLTNRKTFEKRYDLKSYDEWYRNEGKRDIMNLIRKNRTKGICFKCVTTHEIGHTLGLGHSDERSSIMFSYNMREDDNITYADTLAIRRLYEPIKNKIESLRGKCFI